MKKRIIAKLGNEHFLLPECCGVTINDGINFLTELRLVDNRYMSTGPTYKAKEMKPVEFLLISESEIQFSDFIPLEDSQGVVA